MNEQAQMEMEIEDLRHELSVTIPQEMQTASEMGDLRENSEFSSAVARQHFVSIRLKQLATRLEEYRSIDLTAIPRDRVGLGSIVKARNLNTEKIVYFRIVFADITDADDTTDVTLRSPIGLALQNKKVKDEVTVFLPGQRTTYRILGIKTIHDCLKPS